MKETFPALSDDEGDESSSVTSPLLQGRKDLARMPTHAISAPLLGIRPKITRQRRYDRSLGEETRTLNSAVGHDVSDWRYTIEDWEFWTQDFEGYDLLPKFKSPEKKSW